MASRYLSFDIRKPLRLEFFGDEIDSIKIFDVDTQRSTEDVSQFLIFPAEDPLSGITPLELMDGSRYFFSDSIQEREELPRGYYIFFKIFHKRSWL